MRKKTRKKRRLFEEPVVEEVVEDVVDDTAQTESQDAGQTDGTEAKAQEFQREVHASAGRFANYKKRSSAERLQVAGVIKGRTHQYVTSCNG